MSDAPEIARDREIQFGDEVYDEDGSVLGTVRGFDEDGFYVTTEAGRTAMSIEHRVPSESGEAMLMWRCWECGAMGRIAEIPDACPDCDAPREDLYYWTED